MFGGVVAISMVGWFGVQNSVFGQGMASIISLTDFIGTQELLPGVTPEYVFWAIVTGIGITLLVVFGIKAIANFATIFVPLFIAVVLYAAVVMLQSNDLGTLVSMHGAGPALSMGAAIFLTQYAPAGPVTTAVKTAIETLSSLPSIVVGLFGMLVFVLFFGWGFSIISGALALTIFNVPILVRVMQQALEAVPQGRRDSSLALGLTRWETTIHVLIPSAIPAIVTGVVLSAGRVFGEAATLIYTAGQSAPALDFTNVDLTSPTCPWNVFRPAETLAVHIWKINSEGVVPDLAVVSAGSAAVLVACVLVFNILARVLGRALERKVTAA